VIKEEVGIKVFKDFFTSTNVLRGCESKYLKPPAKEVLYLISVM